VYNNKLYYAHDWKSLNIDKLQSFEAKFSLLDKDHGHDDDIPKIGSWRMDANVVVIPLSSIESMTISWDATEFKIKVKEGNRGRNYTFMCGRKSQLRDALNNIVHPQITPTTPPTNDRAA